MTSKVLNDIEKISNKVKKSLTPRNPKVNVDHLVSGLLIVYAVLLAPPFQEKQFLFLDTLG